MDAVFETVSKYNFQENVCEVFSFSLSKLGTTFIISLTFLQVLSHTSIKLTPLT